MIQVDYINQRWVVQYDGEQVLVTKSRYKRDLKLANLFRLISKPVK